MGYEPFECDSEEEARRSVSELIKKKKWPCYFFESDTTGEKPFEEFFTGSENLEMNRYKSIGIIKNHLDFNDEKLSAFLEKIKKLRDDKYWVKQDILDLYFELLPDFMHEEKGKYLDQRM